MKIECRLYSGHLIGEIEVPDFLMEKKVPAVCYPERGREIATKIMLDIGQWEAPGEPRRRIFKVKFSQLARLRALPQFDEWEGFKFYDEGRVETLALLHEARS